MFDYSLRRILMIWLLLCLLISISSCSLEPPVFTGGIRVESTERLVLVPGSEFPVAGDVNTGVEIFIIGPGTGTDSSFSGVTGANGVSDYPNARTNATWTVSLVSSIGCLFGPATRNVPAQGGRFEFNCLVF